jgi:hypothetical protein
MATELVQDIWSRYGFRGNPFDTAALSSSAGALLPVSKAIVGRDMESTESKMLSGILRNVGGGRVVVEGDVGVGKTTFVNYHRYLWEVEAKDKLLTPATEITLSGNLDVAGFVNNIVGAVLGKIVLLQGEKYVHRRPLLHELFLLNRVFTHRSLDVHASLFGFGGGVGKSSQASMPEPTEVQLLSYLRDLVGEVKRLGFKGIFLHFDNMELASLRNPEGTRDVFERLRDVFQIPDVYFVFVAQRGFFNEIVSPLERVRSVFSGFPVLVPPLSKPQLLEAIHRRYELLAVQKDRFIRPVDDKLLTYLYELYDGKIRFVLDAITSIATNLPHVSAETLDVTSAKAFLAELVIDRLQHEVTGREWDVLRQAVNLSTFTNADIATALKQQRQNISKYFNSLLDKRFIYPHHRDGKKIYYCASEDVRIISDVPEKTLKKLVR